MTDELSEKYAETADIPLVIVNDLHIIYPYRGTIYSLKTRKPIGFMQTNGYMQVEFNQKKKLFHRYMYECCHNVQLSSKDMIDHIDHNKLNNRINNLRRTDGSGNNQNRPNPKRLNPTSQYRGVSKTKDGKFTSAITINKRRKSLGIFENELDASKAYIDAAQHANATMNTSFFLDDQY